MDTRSQLRTQASKPGGRIMVVDDEPYVVEAVCELLRIAGYQTTPVYAGQQAQRLLNLTLESGQQPINLILLDRTMPGMSGLDLCRWIKQHPTLSRLPVLMLTGLSTADDKMEGLDTGADDYVTKPYHPGVLLSRIQALLRSYRLEQELLERNLELASLYQNLQTTANTLQALFDGVTDGLYIVEPNWQLAAVNQGRAKQVPAQVLDLINKTCFQALYNRQGPCTHCQVANSFASGRGGHWVERRRQTGGRFAEWELATYPIFDGPGNACQIIIFRREVTERRQLEASLAQAEKLAAVGQLAAGVAHEINNPLTAIIANAQFLTEDLSPDEETHQSAELIVRAGERAARVVRRLLDFARREELKRRPMDINASLREALTLLSTQLSASHIQVITNLETELPTITASADHIQGIWLNLLINARDALSSKSGERIIQVHSRLNQEHIEIIITDNGPGISPEQLPHIFHPFYTTKAPGQGTGLGLSTSYLSIEQHGGRINVISEPGQGTAFTVRLPIRN